LRTICDYVHLNAARAGLVGKAEALENYRWSSCPAYLGDRRRCRPSWLRVERLLGEHGIAQDSLEGRREFSLRLEARRREPEDEAYKSIRRGWKFGAEDFLERIKEKIPTGRHDLHEPSQVRETMALKA
jgi:hypothetical protein